VFELVTAKALCSVVMAKALLMTVMINTGFITRVMENVSYFRLKIIA